MSYLTSKFKALIVSVSLIYLLGCTATQQPIALSENALTNKDAVVGIVVTKLPQAETIYTGSIGLLDYAIIAAANGSLDKYLKALTFEEYDEVPNLLQQKIEQHGLTTKLLPMMTPERTKKLKAPANSMSKNDFADYKAEHNIDYLLLVQAGNLGTTRSYYGPVPTSEPLATSAITGQLIDLSNNKLLWYSRIVTNKTIDTPWDESEKDYPNLTTALYQSLNETIQVLKTGLTNTNDVTAKKAETEAASGE